MGKQLKELSEDECELEMTPMIDVTFLLLIFFMCTLKFKTLEGKLAAYLPKDVGVNQSQAEPMEKVEVMLRVRKEGDKMKPLANGKLAPYDGNGRFVYVDRVVEYAVGTLKTQDLDVLSQRLQELRRKDPERPTTIDPRPGTTYSDVIKVLDEAIAAGYTDITFVGAYDEHIK